MDKTLNSFETDVTVVTGGIGETMDSYTYNRIMSGIEAELNSLYEKVRILNDVKDFCRKYIVSGIEEKRDELVSELKRIERLSDEKLYKNKRKYAVDILPCTEKVAGKDNVLSPMNVSGKMIESPGKTVLRADVLSVDTGSSFPCYKTNAESFSDKRESLSVYKTEEPAEGGIKEDWLILFKEEQTLNYLSIGTINCDVIKLTAIDGEANEVPIELKSNYINPFRAAALRFSLVSKHYYAVKEKRIENTSEILIKGKTYRRNEKLTVSDEMRRTGDAERTAAQRYYRGAYKKQAEELLRESFGKSVSREAGAFSFEGRNAGNDAFLNRDGSLIIPSSGGYRYIPKEEVSVSADSSEDMAAELREFPLKKDMGEETAYIYSFGLSSFIAEYREPERISGYISRETVIGNCGEVNLSVDGENLDGGTVFYITDGTQEKAVLPREISEITDEPLSADGKTVFGIDRNYPVLIKRNGSATDFDLESVSTEVFEEGIYTVDYVPKDAWSTAVKGDRVKIKVVSAGKNPVTIRSLSIETSGGTGLWNMQE